MVSYFYFITNLVYIKSHRATSSKYKPQCNRTATDASVQIIKKILINTENNSRITVSI